MPYKNPEDKRQWERNHQIARNARRRAQRLVESKRAGVGPQIMHVNLKNQHPDPHKETKSTWKFVLGIGAFVLAASAGILAVASGLKLSTLSSSES